MVCGRAVPALAEVVAEGVHHLPERPGKADVDPLLPAEGQAHLVVVGTDADLAAVVLRLLRKEKLASTTIGYVPAEESSAVASLWDLPTDTDRAMALANTGDVDPVPLLRDDAGGVLVGRGELGPVRGVAYCDDEVALRGQASRIVVEADDTGGPGLVAQVTRGAVFKRRITYSGRAFQLGCVPAIPTYDGVRHPRPMKRWTWYRHTEDLRLVRGLA
nr:hypothetical protein [Amycolatopsis antarctica]